MISSVNPHFWILYNLREDRSEEPFFGQKDEGQQTQMYFQAQFMVPHQKRNQRSTSPPEAILIKWETGKKFAESTTKN